MGDSRLLYDAFNIYYEKGMKALHDNDFIVAKTNILAAAESLYKLAKTSKGNLRDQRVRRADELVELARQIDKKIEVKQTSNSVSAKDTKNIRDDVKVEIIDNENVTLEEALDELNSLEGLRVVKQQVSDLVDQIKVFKLRNEQGLPTPEMSYHMSFNGAPGTGKTTVARIIGKIYKSLGILSKGHLVEVDRSDLVAGYVGQTALKTKAILDKAAGGVLFIDEAYSLNKEGNDFGQEAIDTLNKAMEDNRADLVVIVAGYDEEMEKFISSNQGLKSRFRTKILFDNYSGEELYNIFFNILKKNKYIVTSDANKAIHKYLNEPELNQFTGNARDVRNLFENIISLQARRVANLSNPSVDEIITIEIDDLPFKVDPKTINSVKKHVKNEENCDSSKKKTSKIDIKNYLKKQEKPDGDDENVAESEWVNSSTNTVNSNLYKFNWDSLPIINFDDIAGLEDVKDVVRTKVLLPLQHPEAFEGYVKKNGGGLFLYGPPGTGKTMIAAAIANEIGAKFCSVKPSDLIQQGAGNTEKAVRSLFAQARQFPCSVIYFDEMDSLAQKNTKSSYSRQLRSELLAQLQGIESYTKETGNLLFLIAATNKPWEVDSAFVRPGRFGTRIYVGLPDEEAREYMIYDRFQKIMDKGIVELKQDIDVDTLVGLTKGFNGSDISNLLDTVEDISVLRGVSTGEKYICNDDFNEALEKVHSSVQADDIEKLLDWKTNNDA